VTIVRRGSSLAQRRSATAIDLHSPSSSSAPTQERQSHRQKLYYLPLRTAGAQVRKVLIANAAQQWGVDAASLRAT
jgi:hypothetical protein